MNNLINGHIYKPRRLLYYIHPTDEEKTNFYQGILPDSLMCYDGAFGTYDHPGLFRILDTDGFTEVMGIEFRPEDNRIKYPADLEICELPACYMISALITEDSFLSEERVVECIKSIMNSEISNDFYAGIQPLKDTGVIQIFSFQNKKRVYIQVSDVSEEKLFANMKYTTEREKNLFNAAYVDPISGHYNWNYLWPILSGFGYKGIQDYAFVHFDIKDFNALNVVYGHEVANKVLRKVADHMKEVDWIYYSCRCDNDNFSMMIKDMKHEEISEKLMKFFDEISTLEEDKHYHIYYRCGVVPMRNCLLLSNRVADAGKLVQRLGTKLNQTEVLFYTDKMHDEIDWATKIKAYLDTAIEQDEFLVYLQPKYDIDTEKLHGAEALIRWKYQGGDMISPGRFIPAFEKGGCIGKVDDIVLKKVCEYFKKWAEEGLRVYPISVNLSRKRIGDAGLINHLTRIVDSYGIDHSLIDFELTESAAYDDPEYMVSVINDLKANGFRVSLDDFGTGYSSFSLLTTMPIDTLKIDKSFVDGIVDGTENSKDNTVIKHIISMAKDLNLTCLAEGAEEKYQVDTLKDFGCEVIQGYYFSRPLPVEEYEKLLADR